MGLDNTFSQAPDASNLSLDPTKYQLKNYTINDIRPNNKTGQQITKFSGELEKTLNEFGSYYNSVKQGLGSSDSGTSNTGTSIFSGKSFKTDAGNGFNVTSTFDENGNLSMNMSHSAVDFSKQPQSNTPSPGTGTQTGATSGTLPTYGTPTGYMDPSGPFRHETIWDNGTTSSLYSGNGFSPTATNTAKMSTGDKVATFGQSVMGAVTNIGSQAVKAGIKEGVKVAAKEGAKKGLEQGLKSAGSAAKSAVSGIGGANLGIGLADAALNIFSDKIQNQSDLTKGLNTAYDVLSTAANFIPVAGPVVSLIMSGNKLLADSLTAAGVGTDQVTTTDQILDSAFLKLLTLPNAIWADKTSSFNLDREALAGTGNAYSSTAKYVEKNHKYSGKKVGAIADWFEGDGIREKLENAGSDMQKLSKIHDENQIALAGMASPVTGLKDKLKKAGGVRGMLQAAKHGASLYDRDTYKRIIALKQAKKLGNGGTVTRSLEELIQYAKDQNPRFIQRMNEWPRAVVWSKEEDDGYTYDYSGTHEMTYTNKDGKWLVFPMIQELQGNLHRFTDWNEALESALQNNNYLEVNNEEEAKLFSESNDTEHGYKKGWPEFFNQEWDEDFNSFMNSLPEKYYKIPMNQYNLREFWEQLGKPQKFNEGAQIQEFRKGGAFNVIPEGALHKNKHHLEDIDDKFKEVTHKGIPVISEEGDEIIQHAEVEKEEIILRYEVTKKIEKLMKEGTDEAAIKAGELLVKEILYNTIDETKRML